MLARAGCGTQRMHACESTERMQVLANVAARLRDMHDAGYAHRDLKPPNVMWLPRENRWTVIDFGCSARIGESAPLSFTLAYAAPEVITAMTAGEREIVATGALDVWAVGVMAFEMLTGSTAFAMPFVSKNDVRPHPPSPCNTAHSTQHAHHRTRWFTGSALDAALPSQRHPCSSAWTHTYRSAQPATVHTRAPQPPGTSEPAGMWNM